MDFERFFKTATGIETGPFDYQRRLACGERNARDASAWLTTGADCESKLINIPTGCGKTAGVVLAWLWNRVAHPEEKHRTAWPRRLVYCLPMRTLVEQTAGEVKKWLETISKEFPTDKQIEWLAKNSPVILMGGEETKPEQEQWDIHPERPAILIGTQDMLLSRALNRGYGMSRYRWPMHFGLLNNDALWVMDETQLMGVSVETSAQLDAFRAASAFLKCPTWWMSATLDRAQLNTVDHREPDNGWPTIALNESDLTLPAVRKRIEARKTPSSAPFALTAETKKDYAKRLAELIVSRHQKDTLTLVVVNRVLRAQEIYSALGKSGIAKEKLALIHSRFRPADRQKQARLLYEKSGDRIVIATQAVEAGVDVSARLLITELAPWSSLVQRFGRCNRGGEFSEADVVWVDVDTGSEDLASPYSAAELNTAREGLKQAGSDVGAASLKKVEVSPLRVIRPVLRRKDLLDLFDTTPDLCGNDLDISRYIRDGDDTDVEVFWRDLPDGKLIEEIAAPDRRELCSVSLAEFAKFLSSKTKPRVLVWNALEDGWQPETKRVRPGGLYLVAVKSGGYSDELGWTRDPGDKPADLQIGKMKEESYDANRETFIGRWLSIKDHTADVVKAARELSSALTLNPSEKAAIETAALWHDIGKAHPIFQEMLTRGNDVPPEKKKELQAKSDKFRGGPRRNGKPCKGFRHELASALAWLGSAPDDAIERDLAAYLIAAHHGKVRLSIRALPNEAEPDGEPDRLHARGIWDGEELPQVALEGVAIGPVKLDLSFMQMGEAMRGENQLPSPSWLSRMLALRDRLGPFRLAYLETVLRVADIRASASETSNT